MSTMQFVKLCACGCGQPTPVVPASVKSAGLVRDQPYHFARGHNTRQYRSMAPTELLESRMAKLDRSTSTLGCWLWTGEVAKTGYGVVRRDTRRRDLGRMGAHRYFYEAIIGPIPDGLELDHLCRVPACVNPDHLEPVTHAENMRRSLSPAAITARRGICQRGHRQTPENVYVNQATGKRQCKPCIRRGQRLRAGGPVELIEPAAIYQQMREEGL